MRVTLSADRERDGRATAPAPFSSGTNLLRVPGYPEELRDVVPRADGQVGRRDERFYGPDWIRAERVRAIKLQTDLVFQFARDVAGITGHALDTYWRGGGGGHSAITDMLIANVVVDFSQLSAGGTLDAETVAKHRAELERAFAAVDDYDTKQRVAGLAKSGTLTDGDPALGGLGETPEERAAIDRLLRLADEKDFTSSSSGKKGRASASAPPPPPLVSAASLPARPVTATGPLLSNLAPPPSSSPLHERAGPASAPQVHRRVILSTPREEGEREAAAPSGETPPPRLLSATDPATGRAVYGVNNSKILLLRLLLRGVTSADLEAWRMLYDLPEKGKNSQESRARMLKDIATMQTLLRRGEGGVDWVRAPQHTGYIFFSDAFGSAVQAAVSDVHGICGKPWAAEIDLMTHDRVRHPFARLVANHITAARAKSASRWGGAPQMIREHRAEHGSLVTAFRRLAVDADGYLGFDGQIRPADEAARRATERDRNAYTARTGRYYSDVLRDED
jgi:hypothetical protein